MNGPPPEKAPREHPVAWDSHPQPVALGGSGALRRTEVPPDANKPMRRMNSLLLLMIFCTGKTAYVVAQGDPRGGHGRGGEGASGQPEKYGGRGLWDEWEHQTKAKNDTKWKQLYGKTWRTELNRTRCTAGREYGAHGDTRFIAGGGLSATQETPEEKISGREAETHIAPKNSRHGESTVGATYTTGGINEKLKIK